MTDTHGSFTEIFTDETKIENLITDAASFCDAYFSSPITSVSSDGTSVGLTCSRCRGKYRRPVF